MRGFLLALVVVYLLMAIPLRSRIQPAIVMTAIPFGFVGAVWGHLIMGLPLTILSMFGIVAPTGVAVHRADHRADGVCHPGRSEEGDGGGMAEEPVDPFALTRSPPAQDSPSAVIDDTSDGRPAAFEPVEHTADLGLRVWGPTLRELFRQAALGMVSLLVDPSKVRAAEEREVIVESVDVEEALVGWLQEILYFYEVGRFVPCEVEVADAGPKGARGLVRGEPFDGGRHETRADIKAATYHDLKIRATPLEDGSKRWECVVIFDT